MKNITVSVDEETYRMARITAAERGTSVSAMVREFLKTLTAVYKDPPRTPERTLDEIVEAIFARGGGINPRENLTREEIYDHNAFR